MSKQGQGDAAVVVQRMVRGVPHWGFDCARGFVHFSLREIAEEGARSYREGFRGWRYRPIADCPLVESAEPSGVQGDEAQTLYDLYLHQGWGSTHAKLMVQREHPQFMCAPAAPESSADAAQVNAQSDINVSVMTPERAHADLHRIFDDLQNRFHDQWDWMDAHFAADCLFDYATEAAHLTPRETAPADAALDCVRELREALQKAIGYIVDPDAELAVVWPFRHLIARADALLAQGDAGAGDHICEDELGGGECSVCMSIRMDPTAQHSTKKVSDGR